MVRLLNLLSVLKTVVYTNQFIDDLKRFATLFDI